MIKWSDELIQQKLKEVKGITELYQKYPGAYFWLRKNNKLQKVKSYLQEKYPSEKYTRWSMQKILELIEKENITKITELYKKYPGAHAYAKRNNKLNEVKESINKNKRIKND